MKFFLSLAAISSLLMVALAVSSETASPVGPASVPVAAVEPEQIQFKDYQQKRFPSGYSLDDMGYGGKTSSSYGSSGYDSYDDDSYHSSYNPKQHQPPKKYQQQQYHQPQYYQPQHQPQYHQQQSHQSPQQHGIHPCQLVSALGMIRNRAMAPLRQKQHRKPCTAYDLERIVDMLNVLMVTVAKTSHCGLHSLSLIGGSTDPYGSYQSGHYKKSESKSEK